MYEVQKLEVEINSSTFLSFWARSRWSLFNIIQHCWMQLCFMYDEGGWGTPYGRLYGEALPEMGAFFKLAVY